MEKREDSHMASKGKIGADLILHNGSVITLDRSSAVAEAVAVCDGRIAAVGASAGVMASASPATRLIDLRGRTLVPGFYDAHPHMDREALKPLGGIPIAGLSSIADIVDVVRNAVRFASPGEWIILMPMGKPPS